MLEVSVGISGAPLLAHVAYVLFGILGLESFRETKRPADTRYLSEQTTLKPKARSPVWLSLGILVAATLLLIPVIDSLTSSVQPVTQLVGWTSVFVGMIVIANAGNVAEGYATIKFAALKPAEANDDDDSGVDLALGIASVSSIQIAAFVAPLIVLYSLFAHPMNLVFSPIEVAILGLLVLLFAYIAQDGESNWLEGAQLLVLYAMAAVVFYALPEFVFGG